jgi:hypothetical protein
MNSTLPDLRLSGRVHGWQSPSSPLFAGDGDCRVTMASRSSDYVHVAIHRGGGAWSDFHLPPQFSSSSFLQLENHVKLRKVHDYLKGQQGRTARYQVPAGRSKHAYVIVSVFNEMFPFQ